VNAGGPEGRAFSAERRVGNRGATRDRVSLSGAFSELFGPPVTTGGAPRFFSGAIQFSRGRLRAGAGRGVGRGTMPKEEAIQVEATVGRARLPKRECFPRSSSRNKHRVPQPHISGEDCASTSFRILPGAIASWWSCPRTI